MKKILALLMALLMLVSFAACGGNDTEEETTTGVEETTEDAAVGGEIEDTTDEDVTDEPETEVVTDESGETVTDKNGEAVTEEATEKEEGTTKKTNSTGGATQATQASIEDPSGWSTAKVLEYYNAATGKVASQKPGYTKERTASIGTYEAGLALQAFKGEVFKFLGIGSENKFSAVVPKGKNTTDDKCGDFLKKSTLTTSDVSSAKAVKNGSNYVITIGVNAGSTSIEGGANSKNNSPIDKTGICAPGNADRSGFDHKSAQVTYAALQDFASGLVMKEQTKNGKIVATVNAATGEISKLVITWDASAELSKVMGSSATLSASTTVTYSKFGW